MKNYLQQGADELGSIVRDILAGYFHRNSAEGQMSEQEALFRSKEALHLRQEMVWNAWKLWERQYVDGNGGNLSCRIGDEYVLCTPSMCSKADLTLEDLCLVDLEGNQKFGRFKRTSELLLHLEIYKANPAARAVIHCHPPHATAYAIAGQIPPPDLVPEQEVFVGPVAISPYETPGTKVFAETILPFVERHNAILLANHGVVCWPDTVTHAEWLIEVLDTYCKTVLLALQLGSPLRTIPRPKLDEILKIKAYLGLPDARFESQPAHSQYDFPVPLKAQTVALSPESEVEVLARSIAAAVRARFGFGATANGSLVGSNTAETLEKR